MAHLVSESQTMHGDYGPIGLKTFFWRPWGLNFGETLCTRSGKIKACSWNKKY